MLLQTYCWYFLQKQKGYFQQIAMQLFSIKLQFNSNHDCQKKTWKIIRKSYAEIVAGL